MAELETLVALTQTTEPANRRGTAQLKTQPDRRTNLGSEIGNNLTHYVSVSLYLQMCA